MESKNQYFNIIKNMPFDDSTKVLLMQSYSVGYVDGKHAAFTEAMDIVSNSKKNEPTT
jgi:hypothetical protein